MADPTIKASEPWEVYFSTEISRHKTVHTLMSPDDEAAAVERHADRLIDHIAERFIERLVLKGRRSEVLVKIEAVRWPNEKTLP